MTIHHNNENFKKLKVKKYNNFWLELELIILSSLAQIYTRWPCYLVTRTLIWAKKLGISTPILGISPNYCWVLTSCLLYSLNYPLQAPWIVVAFCQSDVMTNLLWIPHWTFVIFAYWSELDNNLFLFFICFLSVVCCMSLFSYCWSFRYE